MIINDIQVYTMSDKAYNYFCLKAKNCTNKSKEFIERKLSSLIHNATSIKQFKGNLRCTFCGFTMVTDMNKNIVDLYWQTSDHRSVKFPTKDLKENVSQTNLLLGLTEDGNEWA